MRTFSLTKHIKQRHLFPIQPYQNHSATAISYFTVSRKEHSVAPSLFSVLIVLQMQFIAPTLLAIMAVVSAAPVLETRQNGVTCQTSNGSPFTDAVTDVINQLKGYGADAICENTNDEASRKSKIPFADVAIADNFGSSQNAPLWCRTRLLLSQSVAQPAPATNAPMSPTWQTIFNRPVRMASVATTGSVENIPSMQA